MGNVFDSRKAVKLMMIQTCGSYEINSFSLSRGDPYLMQHNAALRLGKKGGKNYALFVSCTKPSSRQDWNLWRAGSGFRTHDIDFIWSAVINSGGG